MKIKKSQMYEFYTEYKIEYKGKEYVCNYNGGLPKLVGKRISEKEGCELKDLIEEYFISNPLPIKYC